MRCADSHGIPASALDAAFLSPVAIPLLLAISTSAGLDCTAGDSLDGGGIAPASVASQEDDDEDEVASSDEVTPIEPEGAPSLYDEASAASQSATTMDGYLNFRTRSRWAVDHEQDDHDLYGVVSTDILTAGPKGWGIHVLLRGSIGLDSQPPGSIFYGVQDTYKNQFDGRIYHAYVDAPLQEAFRLTRFGRTIIYDTPATAYFDGLQLETNPVGPTDISFGAYGGSSVHLFESWPSDEWMGGLYASLRPWKGGNFRVDWMRLKDDARFGEGDNDLVSLGLIHRLNDNLRLEGDYSVLDGKGNDARVKGFWTWPRQDMTVRLTYYELLRAQNNLAYELNPYFNTLNTYYPYRQSQLVVSKAFGEVFDLYGGLDVRRVDDEANIGRYNRDFDRYYLTAALPEQLPLDTTMSLTGEVWDSPGNDIQTWGLDLTSRFNADTKASIGSYYSLYKYYMDIATERENVRTFYAELRKSVSDSTNLMVRYEYENEEIDTFHNLRLGVTWRF